MAKRLEVNPLAKLVGRRAGAPTGSRLVATIVANPGTAPNGAQKERVDQAAK